MSRLALIAIAWLAIGCGDDESPPPAGPTGPLVVYERTGGVAGVVERLRVDRDGRAQLIAGPEADRVAFRLEPSEVERLEDELAAAGTDQPEGPPGCADCFEYTLIYAGATLRFDQLAGLDPPLQAVLSHLGDLVAAHQPGA